MEPAALDPARPNAIPIVVLGSFFKTAIAATAPKMPAVDVLCMP